MLNPRLLAPIAWTLAIAWFSTDGWSQPRTGGLLAPFLHRLLPWMAPEAVEALHWLARKAGHAVEYGILGALCTGRCSCESRSREGLEFPGFTLPCVGQAGKEMMQREVRCFCDITIKLVNEMTMLFATSL